MKKLSVKPKRIRGSIPIVADGIAFDDWRRLRNALIALAGLDPGWIIWIERHVPARISDVGVVRQIVERQARVLLAKNYSFLGPGFVRGMIDSEYYFTDDGNLKTYR